MLLAIDSATDTLGLAVTDGSRILAEVMWLSPQHATVEVAPETARLLRRLGISGPDLSGLAVAIGPGSYTGLRIGLAFAKGLAMGLGLKIVGVPTLEILARGQPMRSDPMVVLARAGRGRWSAAWYKASKRGWKAEGEPTLFDGASLSAQIDRPTYVCGELTAEERAEFAGKRNLRLADAAMCVRRPAVLAQIGWERLRKASDPLRLVPVYPAALETAAA